MPVRLELLKKKIWDKLKRKTNPRTKKPYTESEAWAIATSQWKKSGKNLYYGLDEEFESEPELLSNAIRKMEEK